MAELKDVGRPSDGALQALRALAEVERSGEDCITIARLMYELDCSRNTARARLKSCVEEGLVEVWDRSADNGVTLPKGFRLTAAGRSAIGLPEREVGDSGEALLPCPMCGGAAMLTDPYKPEAGQPAAVSCLHCGLLIIRDDPDEAVRCWNTRVGGEVHGR